VMVQQGKRTGVYDVRVTNEAGHLVALMRGKSAAIQGTVLTDSAPTT
jgi:acyl-CoA thioesterase